MPVLTSTFVLVTWLMLLGQGAFKALTPASAEEPAAAEEGRAG
jgi:urea transporter